MFFNRRELKQLLSIYSRRVASGEWRDYAIDHAPGMAAFSVFRHSHDRPLFTVAKCAAAGVDADFQVFSARRKLRSGRSIDEVLYALDGLRVVS